MLATNKPKMQKVFSDMIADKTGMLYKAAYNAYYDTTERIYNEQQKNIAEYLVNNSVSGSDGSVDAPDKSKWAADAKVFASSFVKALRDAGFDKTLADEIDTHVKSAQIDITVPALQPTIVSPMGPCSGSLVISQPAGAQIIIS
jgi:hypothetical protein